MVERGPGVVDALVAKIGPDSFNASSVSETISGAALFRNSFRRVFPVFCLWTSDAFARNLEMGMYDANPRKNPIDRIIIIIIEAPTISFVFDT